MSHFPFFPSFLCFLFPISGFQQLLLDTSVFLPLRNTSLPRRKNLRKTAQLQLIPFKRREHQIWVLFFLNKCMQWKQNTNLSVLSGRITAWWECVRKMWRSCPWAAGRSGGREEEDEEEEEEGGGKGGKGVKTHTTSHSLTFGLVDLTSMGNLSRFRPALSRFAPSPRLTSLFSPH